MGALDTAATVHGPRFIFYANELVGLGHLRRTLAIATRLAEGVPTATSLILTGSSVEPTLRLPPRVDTVKLPGGSRDEGGNHRARRLGVGADELWTLRSRIAVAAATGFAPDVAIIDKLPLGQGGELRPTLDALRRSRCRIVLGLRDIEDSAENVRRKWGPEVREAIERYYDAILVYGPESTPDAIDCLGWYDLAVPVHHVGYVGTAIPAAGPADMPGGYVLVTAGGGFDGFPVLATFARALRLRPLPCRAVMVTGPMMAPDERAELAELVRGLDVELCELRRDMEHVVAGARAVVTMAGYNTVSELMRAGKPALLVPRTGPSQEQLIRALNLARSGLQDMLHPAELTPATLREALDRLLVRTAPAEPPAAYSGTGPAAGILSDLAERVREEHAALRPAVLRPVG